MGFFTVYRRKPGSKGRYERFFSTPILEQAEVGCRNLSRHGWDCYYKAPGIRSKLYRAEV